MQRQDVGRERVVGRGELCPTEVDVIEPTTGAVSSAIGLVELQVVSVSVELVPSATYVSP